MTATETSPILDAFDEELRRWAADPVAFAEERLGCTGIWEGSRRIMEAVRDHPKVAVQACHSSSKTWTAANIAWWWSQTGCPSKVITTAPGGRQVGDQLWSEINARFANAALPIPGECMKTRWGMPGEADWYMSGFATRPDQGDRSATKVHGYHSPNLLAILDEAAAIDRAIFDAIEDGLTASGDAHILAIGNPTDPTSRFAEVCADPTWRVIRISAFDTPNLKAGKIVHPHLVTPEWVEGRERKYGKDSPIYRAKVLALFPDSSEDALVSLSAVQQALARPVITKDEDATVTLGVDAARFGSDPWVFYAVRGDEIIHAESRHGWGERPEMQAAGRTIALAGQLGISQDEAHHIVFDTTGGYGGGAVDRLGEQGWNVTGLNFGSKANDDAQFLNRRAEIWWYVREWILTACLADAPSQARESLPGDLSTPTYRFNSKGQIQLEAKDAMKKRLGHSPDDGDALALALAGRTTVAAAAFTSEEYVESDRSWGYGMQRRRGR